MIFYCRILECRAQRLKTILNLPTCWEQISAFSKSQKIDFFNQYYTKVKSDYINLQIISREWKYYMVALMNFKLFDRYGGYRVLMFKFNHFNPAGLFSPNNPFRESTRVHFRNLFSFSLCDLVKSSWSTWGLKFFILIDRPK